MIGKVIITSSNPPCRACGGMDGYHYTSCSLVAAAPDLLEACKAARERMWASQSPTTSAIVNQLDAAIAKAEGRPADAPAAPNERETASSEESCICNRGEGHHHPDCPQWDSHVDNYDE